VGGQREYQTVVLAALLHDIGKFIQRGRFPQLDERGPHPHFSHTFVSTLADAFQKVADSDLLKTIVLHHHRGAQFPGPKVDNVPDERARLLAYLVNKADALSAEERGEYQAQDFRTTPLASVFLGVFAEQEPQSTFNFHPLPLLPSKEITIDNLFPSAFATFKQGELEDAIKTFGNNCKSLLDRLGADFHTFMIHLLNLLSVHAACIPSNTQEKVPDISLYDHLKTTCAIAGCLYQYCDVYGKWKELTCDTLSGQPFCLLIGDVSGIQRYIFDIASSERAGGGVGRRLKARSLFVQVISEVIPLKLIRLFNLPPANILMSSGGKFYVLLPNLDSTGERLEDLAKDSDAWFLENLHAELGVNLAWLTFGEDEMGKGFGDMLGRAINRLGAIKEKSFSRAFIIDKRWVTAKFALPPFENNQALCPSCRKFPADRDGFCSFCASDLEWGRSLPMSEYITISLQMSPGERELLGAGIGIYRDKEGLRDSRDLVIRINNPDTSELIKYPANFRYLVKHVLSDEGRVLDFEEIADRSHGRKYLAYLKVDVDRLGEILAFGLRGGGTEHRRDTISRLATLSRQLDQFFTGWMQHLLETEYRDCYAVFSGGDDLFLVGPWQVILDLASRVRADFARLTCYNPRITLSAGIIIVPHHYPLNQAAQEVEKALESSKNHPNGKKNRITILNHTLTWEEWEKVKTDFEKLRDDDVSSAFLYSLIEYGRMFKAYYEKGDVLGLRFQPLLAYNISRNLRPVKATEMHRWVGRLLEWRPNMGNKEIENTLNNLSLIAQLLILWKEGK